MIDPKKIQDVSLQIIKWTNPLAYQIGESITKQMKKSEEAVDKGNLSELKDELLRQELSGKIAEAQARVAQELAIARRIDSAEEVEIEEYYDLHGSGNLGLSVDCAKETVGLGAHAEGRRITKRVYHFKGWRKESELTLEQILTETK